MNQFLPGFLTASNIKPLLFRLKELNHGQEMTKLQPLIDKIYCLCNKPVTHSVYNSVTPSQGRLIECYMENQFVNQLWEKYFKSESPKCPYTAWPVTVGQSQLAASSQERQNTLM